VRVKAGGPDSHGRTKQKGRGRLGLFAGVASREDTGERAGAPGPLSGTSAPAGPDILLRPSPGGAFG